MTAVLYPVAANAEAAFSAPLGRAARAGDARAVAGGRAVRFVQEMVGPGFDTREAALAAFAGRIEDDRGGGPPGEDRYCLLRQVTAEPPLLGAKASLPLRPVYRDGRRWPTPRAAPRTVWRLSISYWRLIDEAGDDPAPDAADPAASAMVRARLDRPMRPLKPQQPLDIGLFEFRPPEAPHILMPDE